MAEDVLQAYLERIEEIFQHLVRRLHQELCQKGDGAVTGSQFFVLKKINERGKLSVSDVADEMCVSLSATTVLVDRLCRAGMLVRKRDEKDRRVVWLELTAKGRETLNACQESRISVFKRYFAQLPEEDMEKLLEIYDKLAAIIKKEAEKKKE